MTANQPMTPEEALQASLNVPESAPKKARSKPGKTGRARAREFIVQALYQHLIGGNSTAAIDQFTRELAGFHKGDSAHFDAVFHGCVEQAAQLDTLITPKLDRKMKEISPIERACMWIGVYELQYCPDVPWRVVLNECIELAKSFGGTDGHKYVNGVLGALAPELRQAEVLAERKNTVNT